MDVWSKFWRRRAKWSISAQVPNPQLQKTMLGQVASLLIEVEKAHPQKPPRAPDDGWSASLADLTRADWDDDASEEEEDEVDVPAWGDALAAVPFAYASADGGAEDAGEPTPEPGERPRRDQNVPF